MTRKLASKRVISNIQPIPNADAIEVATVDGWQVVIKKGAHAVSEEVLYLEVDTWVPEALAPFLSKGKSYNDVPGARLKTIKLRGQVSQGLLLKWDASHEFAWRCGKLDEYLKLQKWEPPAIGGPMEQKGTRPYFVPKTNQERVQNIVARHFYAHGTHKWAPPKDTFEVTIKLEGSSMSVYKNDGHTGVCSRNMDLKDVEGNKYWQAAKQQKLIELCPEGYVLQGELMGPGIQGNIEKLIEPTFFLFDIYDVTKDEYLTPDKRRALATQLGIIHAPVLHERFTITQPDIKSVLELADGPSINAKRREGLVFKSHDRGFTFKVISNAYLLKQNG